MTIGQAIRKARKAKGYTLEKLADKAGITFTTIGHWERGETSPNVVPLMAVADVLNITLDELIGRSVAK